MNDTMMTLIGNVVDEPRTRETKNGHSVTNFRIASTSRKYDRELEKFVDVSTLFVNVTCWRGFGVNVQHSLRKGAPVIVFGRYSQRDYEKEEQVRTSYELEAMAVGHDLSRGVAKFERVYQNAPVNVPIDEDGLPADDSDTWLGVIDAELPPDPEFAAAV